MDIFILNLHFPCGICDKTIDFASFLLIITIRGWLCTTEPTETVAVCDVFVSGDIQRSLVYPTLARLCNIAEKIVCHLDGFLMLSKKCCHLTEPD